MYQLQNSWVQHKKRETSKLWSLDMNIGYLKIKEWDYTFLGHSLKLLLWKKNESLKSFCEISWKKSPVSHYHEIIITEAIHSIFALNLLKAIEFKKQQLKDFRKGAKISSGVCLLKLFSNSKKKFRCLPDFKNIIGGHISPMKGFFLFGQWQNALKFTPNRPSENKNVIPKKNIFGHPPKFHDFHHILFLGHLLNFPVQ